MKDDTVLLNFVRSRLEEGEAISPKALAGLLAVAERPSATPHLRPALLTAASLAVVAAGWLALSASATDDSNLSTALALGRVADGATSEETYTLAENLLAWQDAPALDLAD